MAITSGNKKSSLRFGILFLLTPTRGLPSQSTNVFLRFQWKDETPVFEIVIRETLRLIKTGPALHRNLGDNLQFADQTIDKGAYVVYNMADVHLNEMVYS
jgi:cytochrome P450